MGDGIRQAEYERGDPVVIICAEDSGKRVVGLDYLSVIVAMVQSERLSGAVCVDVDEAGAQAAHDVDASTSMRLRTLEVIRWGSR